MKLDLRAHPELAARYAVVDFDTQEQIEHVAWADDEACRYGVYILRGKTLADRADADLRLRDTGGHLKVKECSGPIEIVDLHASPWREDVLRLLDDDDVRSALKALVIEAMVEGVKAAGSGDD